MVRVRFILVFLLEWAAVGFLFWMERAGQLAVRPGLLVRRVTGISQGGRLSAKKKMLGYQFSRILFRFSSLNFETYILIFLKKNVTCLWT